MTNNFDIYVGAICYYPVESFYILVEVCDIRRGKVEITPVAGDSTVTWVIRSKLYIKAG